VLLWLVLFAFKCTVVLWMAQERHSPDEQLYRQLARSVIDGEGYARSGKPTAMVVPGFPLFLALLLRIAPESHVFPFAANVALSAVLALAYGALLGLLTGRPRLGRWGAVGLFLWPPYIQYACALTTEMANTACLAVALLCFERVRRNPERLGSWLGLGIFHACAFMIRPVVFLLTPVVLLWPLVESRFRPRAFVGAFLAGVTVLAIWLPWVIRNERVFGEFVPLTTYSGITLFAGTLKDFNNYHGPMADVMAEHEIANYFDDEVHSNRVMTRVGKERIGEDRGRYLWLSMTRAWRFWVHDYPWHREFMQRWRSADSPGDYLPLIGRPALQLMSATLLACLLVSLWLLRARRDCWPHMLLIVYYSVMHALLFPIIRYSAPVQGLALVLIAAAAAQVWERRRAVERGTAD
jgi:hypothetical protein